MDERRANIFNTVKKAAKYSGVPIKGFKIFKDLAFVVKENSKRKNNVVKPMVKKKKKSYLYFQKKSKNIFYAFKSSTLTFLKLFRLLAKVLDRL